MDTGDRCYNKDLYEAAKILFNNISNFAKALVQSGEFAAITLEKEIFDAVIGGSQPPDVDQVNLNGNVRFTVTNYNDGNKPGLTINGDATVFQPLSFSLSAAIDTDNSVDLLKLSGQLVGNWNNPFGLQWLTITSLSVTIQFFGVSFFRKRKFTQ